MDGSSCSQGERSPGRYPPIVHNKFLLRKGPSLLLCLGFRCMSSQFISATDVFVEFLFLRDGTPLLSFQPTFSSLMSPD